MAERAKMSGILVFSNHKWPVKSDPFVGTDSIKFTASSTIGDSETGNYFFFWRTLLFGVTSSNITNRYFRAIFTKIRLKIYVDNQVK